MEQEIELLERVLFRLGTSDTDEQLENAVIKFLTPVLLKITSPNETVRCKVMEVLTHVNKRLKSRPLVQLPVEQLLVQYNTTDSSFLHNFSIIYITMGFPRLSVEKQTELTPILLNCLEGKPEVHQDKLLMLVLPLLGAIKIPEDPEKRGTLLGLADKPLTKKQLINLLQDVILLPYGVTSEGEVPPGMSPYSFKRVIANNWKAEELEQLKKGICRFICASVFPDTDILTLLVLASADTRFSVATPAIAELSKVNSSLDWTDPNLSAPFYSLFLGNASKIVDRKTTPCSARVRQKLLQYLLKSRGKGINTVRGIQVIFEALFGENTNQKCKVLCLQFTENLIKDGASDLINKISKVILAGVTKLIGTESTEAFDVQNSAYCVIAQLARVCPDSFNKDLQLIVSYFAHLVVAPTELHSSIREALIAIAPAFSWTYDVKERTDKFSPNANQSLLLAMLAEHVESKLTIAQNVASVFLTTCFPEHFVPARYLLLLIAGERSSLRESIITSLYGVTRTDHINYSYISSIDHAEAAAQYQDPDKNKLSPEQRRVVLPSFKEMVNYVNEQMEKRATNSSQKHIYGKVTLSCQYETYTEILDYLRLCLWFSAGAKTAPGDEKSVQKVNDYIRNELSNSIEIKNYLALSKRILYSKRGKVELQCLYDLLNATPITLVEDCLDLKDSFMLGLKDVSDLTRVLVAQSHGILMAYGNNELQFNAEVKDIVATLSQRTLEHRHGSILMLSHAFQRRIKSMKSESDFNEEKIQNWDELKKVIILLGSLLSEQQSLLVSAAIKGISLIGSSTILPLPDSSAASSVGADAMEVDDCPISKSSLVSTIFRLLKSAHTKAKLREDAAICLGYLAVGDGKYFAASNLKLFIEIVKLSKDTALNIAIAQGIVLTIAGEENIYDDESAHTENPFCDDKTFNDFLNGVIGFVSDPNPCSRNSTSIWLLALVKNFSKRTPIYSRRQTLQFAFTELLSDDSEFIQDVASRGLGLVYSLSDQSGQSDLANSLLDQLIGGRRQVNQVNEDSKIFEEGMLGKTPMGGNITTYKELCSLASDLNQPEMIYKFMQLANHNAAWNSKLGAAFGLKSISKGAKEQMQPFLGKIVPRLFRYKYDPTPKIQNSMISIWDSIVSDSKETVEKYYWEIFDELTTNLTHVEWRVRIACCLAVRDLVKRPAGLRLKFDDRALTANKMEIDSSDDVTKMETDEMDIPEPDLAKLWSQLFRVMDDVHEGTRLAAEGTAKALSKICVVAASINGKSAQIVASSILPLILEAGVTHTVPEIRKLSMKTLSELIESSGKILKYHLHTLVPCLLKATGELEVSQLSYLSTRLGANVEAQEAVDSLRAEAAKQHHSMETLVKCIRHISYESLEKMTPEVVELMKSTVNLGTKIACAHFVCLITVRFNNEMTPLVSKYLSVCFHGLKDRNTIVRKYNASAIGHLIGLAQEKSIIRLFGKLTEFYFENQSNKGVPHAISAINKRHQDILKDYPAHVLPLIFFAMHEEINEDNRSNVELWKELWLEVSPGDGGIRMNLESIIPMLEKSLDDQSWLIKAQSANSITTIATRLGTNLGHVERERLISSLLGNIQGRSFHGKERLLQALASLCKDLKKTESSSYITIIDAIMRECRKEEPLYRTHAIKAIGDILEQLGEDRFEEIYNMIWYLMDKKDLAAVTGDDEDKNLSADERNKRAMIVISLKETVCETLGKAWPNDEKTQEKYQLMFVEQCVRCLQNNTRPVQLSVLISLGKFLDRLKILEAPNTDQNQEKKQKIDGNECLQKICQDVLSAVVYVAGIPHTGLKKEALNIVLILVKRLIDIKSQTELSMVKKTFEEILVTLQKDSAPEIKCRINDIEDKLKST